MKKNYVFKAIVLSFIGLAGSLIGHDSQKAPTEFASKDALLRYFNYNVHFIPSPPSKKTAFQEEWPSMEGVWGDLTIEGKRYYGRLLKSELLGTNVNGIEDVERICSVAAGDNFTTREAIQTCSAVKVSAGITFSSELSQAIKVSIGLQNELPQQECHSIESGSVFSFPAYCEGYNLAIFYTGTRFDLHKLTLEIMPYEADPIALQKCLRECKGFRAPDPNEVASCRAKCQKLYGNPRPNWEKVFVYETNILKPEETHWVVCSNSY